MGTVVLASPCSNSRDLDVTSPTSRILESLAPGKINGVRNR
jgi:hypothetical protein